MSSILFIEKRLRTDKIGLLYLTGVMREVGHDVDMIQTDLEDVDKYLHDH